MSHTEEVTFRLTPEGCKGIVQEKRVGKSLSSGGDCRGEGPESEGSLTLSRNHGRRH